MAYAVIEVIPVVRAFGLSAQNTTSLSLVRVGLGSDPQSTL